MVNQIRYYGILNEKNKIIDNFLFSNIDLDHCYDVNCRITKRELKFWLKVNPDSHIVKHQESEL
jgi:hypothetical protein